MSTIKTVLIPLDGSPFAEQALPLGTEVVRKSGAALHLARVHAPFTSSLEVLELDPSVDAMLCGREQEYLNGIRSRLVGTLPGPVSATLLDGEIATAISDQAQSVGADLVILTTHARGPVARFWLGSIADRLVRLLHIPMLLIPPARSPTATAKIQRVLVPLDRSPLAESVLAPALDIGRLFGASCLLYHAVESMPPMVDPTGNVVAISLPDSEQARMAESRRYLGTVAARLRLNGAEVETASAVADGAAPGILAAAAAHGADLIAIATHGAGGASRMWLGSVADKVIRGSQVPVLVYRPG